MPSRAAICALAALVLTLGVLLYVGWASVQPTDAQEDLYNCPDFTCQEDAQAVKTVTRPIPRPRRAAGRGLHGRARGGVRGGAGPGRRDPTAASSSWRDHDGPARSAEAAPHRLAVRVGRPRGRPRAVQAGWRLPRKFPAEEDGGYRR